MKKFLLIMSTIVTSMCLTGCGVATHSNGQNADCILTNVNLSQNNFRIIGESQGVATATYIFGIGGLSKKFLDSNATAEMIHKANLSGAQAIINKTVDIKTQNYFVVSKLTVTVRGQIVEFK